MAIESMKARTKRAAGLAAAALALVLGIAGMTGVAYAQDTKAPTVVRVGVLNSLAEVVTFMAMEKGYFKEEGLDVRLEKFSNTADMVAPLSSGQIDIASGAPTLGLFNGALRGLPFRLVADKGRNSKNHGFNAIIVRKDLIDSGKVKTAADLKGLKVATASLHSPMEQQLEIALQKVGLSNKDVTIENLGFPDMITALNNKAIDAALMIEPFVAIASKRGVGVRFMGVDDIAPDFQIAGIIYGPEFVAKHPEAAKRWMVGYLKGVRAYLDAVDGNGNKDEVFEALKNHTTNFKDRSALAGVVYPGFNPDGYLNLETIKSSIDWYAEKGLLKAKPKISDLVDYQYLEYALDRIGRRGPPQKVE
jgi:NitT/TauT family transport system substrate-binding protein